MYTFKTTVFFKFYIDVKLCFADSNLALNLFLSPSPRVFFLIVMRRGIIIEIWKLPLVGLCDVDGETCTWSRGVPIYDNQSTERWWRSINRVQKEKRGYMLERKEEKKQQRKRLTEKAGAKCQCAWEAGSGTPERLRTALPRHLCGEHNADCCSDCLNRVLLFGKEKKETTLRNELGCSKKKTNSPIQTTEKMANEVRCA